MKYFVLQARAAESNSHPSKPLRAELVTDTHRRFSSFDHDLRCRWRRQIRLRYDEDSTKFIQGVSQLPIESKLRTTEKVTRGLEHCGCRTSAKVHYNFCFHTSRNLPDYQLRIIYHLRILFKTFLRSAPSLLIDRFTEYQSNWYYIQ